MKNLRYGVLGLMLALGVHFAEAADQAQQVSAAQPNALESIDVQSTGKYTQVILQTSRAVKIKELRAAEGIFLYFTSPILSDRPLIEKVQEGVLEEIRYGYPEGRAPAQGKSPVDYILFKLSGPAKHTVKQQDWVLRVEFEPLGEESRPVRAGDEESAASWVPRSRLRRLALSDRPGIDEIVRVGLANQGALAVAEEEVTLARWRVREASRALFPSVTGKMEKSRGVLLSDPGRPDDDVTFQRRQYGLEAGQPLFHSGQLRYAFQQARAQKRAAEEARRKVRATATLDIVRAYNALLKAQRTLAVRREVDRRAEQVLDRARKKLKLELIAETEGLSAESLYSQIHYRLLSDEKDLELARLKLASVLNLKQSLPATLEDTQPKVDLNALFTLEVPVDTLVAWARTHKPEVLEADALAEAQTRADQAARADGHLRVDASGFLGRAAGAFENEPLDYNTSWNAGIQATLMFGGSSLKGNGSQEKTVPDYGQSSASELKSESISLGLFDNLRQVVDEKQARVTRDKALNERESAYRLGEMDVREAVYNLQRSKIQLRGGQMEMRYREKDAAIARQKEQMNLNDPSQILAAENAYGEAVSSYEEALAYYRVSIASLEKALGTPLEAVASLK